MPALKENKYQQTEEDMVIVVVILRMWDWSESEHLNFEVDDGNGHNVGTAAWLNVNIAA